MLLWLFPNIARVMTRSNIINTVLWSFLGKVSLQLLLKFLRKSFSLIFISVHMMQSVVGSYKSLNDFNPDLANSLFWCFHGWKRSFFFFCLWKRMKSEFYVQQYWQSEYHHMCHNFFFFISCKNGKQWNKIILLLQSYKTHI